MLTPRELRALQRQNWPGGLTEEHEPAQLPTAIGRLNSMWQLACDAWQYSEEPMPEYDRSTMPGKLIRPA